MATLQREDQKESAEEKDESKEKGQENDQDQQKSRAGKKRLRLIIFAVLILAIVVAIPLLSYYSSRESTDDAQVDGHVVPISSRIEGTILSVLVNDNQVLTAGSPLVKLDPADYQVSYDQAHADMVSAEAQANASRTNVPITNINTTSIIRTSSADVISARAGVEASLRQVDANVARLESSKRSWRRRRRTTNDLRKILFVTKSWSKRTKFRNRNTILI